MAVMFIFMASEFGIPFVHHRYTALSELSNSMLKRENVAEVLLDKALP